MLYSFVGMKAKRLSVTEYAELRSIKRQAVLKQIKYGRKLPGIRSYEKVGETWVLTENKKAPL